MARTNRLTVERAANGGDLGRGTLDNLGTRTYERLSLLAITTTAIVTSVHHVYREGWELLVPSLLIVALPYLLIRWFRSTGSRTSLGIYGMFNAWLIASFGIVDGFLDHVVNAFVVLYAATSGQPVDRLERAFRVLPPTPLVGDVLYEGTGILTFVAGLVAAYYGYRFIRAAWSTSRAELGARPA
jgi:hypothetical protein